MITQILYVKEYEDKYAFHICKSLCLWVTCFKKGVVSVTSIPQMRMNEFSKLIAGCFNENSNFETEIMKAFNTFEKINSIMFTYNGIKIIATKGDSAKDICQKYYNVFLENK